MISELRRAQVARLSLADLSRADVSAALLLDEVQRRRSTGAVSDDEVVELLETLLSRDCTGRSSLLREYLLLLAKLSERDASLLERKMRAGTVLGEEQPQALAAAIGMLIQTSNGKSSDALQQLLAAACAKEPSIANAYALLLNKSPLGQLVADVWPAAAAGSEVLLTSLVSAELVAQDPAAWSQQVQASLQFVMRASDTPIAEMAAARLADAFQPSRGEVMSWEVPALALYQMRSESSKYVFEISRLMHAFAAAGQASEGHLPQRLISLAFMAWPSVSLEFAGWQLHNSKATLSEVWNALTTSQLSAFGDYDELQTQLANWEAHQFWSRYASASWLSFRYYFQGLHHHRDEDDDKNDNDNGHGEWLAGITSLAADEALLWLMSALTLTCALAVQPEVPAWTTRGKIRAMLGDSLDAIAKTVQAEPVQGVRVFPHIMFLASSATASASTTAPATQIAPVLFSWLPAIAKHKLSTKQIWQTLHTWANSGSEAHYPLGIEGIAKMAQLGPEITAQAVDQLNRIRPFYATQMSTTPFLQATPVKIAWLNAVSELTKHVSDDDDATQFINDVQLALKDANADVGAAAVRCLKTFVDQDMIDLTAVFRIICKPSNTATLDSNQVQLQLARFCGYVEVKEEEDEEDGEKAEQEAKQTESKATEQQGEDEIDEEVVKLREAYQAPIEHLVVALQHSCVTVRKAAAASLAMYPALALVSQEDELVQSVRRVVLQRFEEDEDRSILDALVQVASKLVQHEIAARISWKDARTADGRLQSSLRETVSNKTIAAVPQGAKISEVLKRAVSDAERQLALPNAEAGEGASFEALRTIVNQHDPTPRLRSDVVLLMQLVEYGRLLSGFLRTGLDRLLSELKGVAAVSPAAVVNICDALTGLAFQLRDSAATPEQCVQICHAYRECRALLPGATDLRTELAFSAVISANWLKCMLDAAYAVPENDDMAKLLVASVSTMTRALNSQEVGAVVSLAHLYAAAEVLRTLSRLDAELPAWFASLLGDLKQELALCLLRALAGVGLPHDQLHPLLQEMTPQLQYTDVFAAHTSNPRLSELGLALALDAWVASSTTIAHKQAVMRLVHLLATDAPIVHANQRRLLMIVSPVLFQRCQDAGVGPAPDAIRLLLTTGAELVAAAVDQSHQIDLTQFDDDTCALAWQFGSLLRYASTHGAVPWETLTKGVQLLLRAATSAAPASGCQTGALLGVAAVVSPAIDGYLANTFCEPANLFSSRLLDRVLLESLLPAIHHWLETAGMPSLAKLFAARALVAIGKLRQGTATMGADSNRYLGAVPVASVLVPAQEGMLSTVLGGVTQTLIGQQQLPLKQHVSFVASCLQVLATADLREGFHSASLCDALISSGGSAVDARAYVAALSYAGHHFARSQDLHYALAMRRIFNLTQNSETELDERLLFELATHLPSMCRSLSARQVEELVLGVLDRIVRAVVLSEVTVLRFIQRVGDLFAEASSDASRRAELEMSLARTVFCRIAERAQADLVPVSYRRVLNAVAEFGDRLQEQTLANLSNLMPFHTPGDSWLALMLLRTQPAQIQRRWLRRWLTLTVNSAELHAVQRLAEVMQVCGWSFDERLGLVRDAYLAAAEKQENAEATNECLAHLTAAVLAGQLTPPPSVLWPRVSAIPRQSLEQFASSANALSFQPKSLLALASQAMDWHCRFEVVAQSSAFAVLVAMCRSMHESIANGSAGADQNRILAEISKLILLVSHRSGTSVNL